MAELAPACSDDYASLRVGNLSFYYGYEVTDEAGEWCFEAVLPDRKVIIREAELRARGAQSGMDRPEISLITGIAILLERGILTVP